MIRVILFASVIYCGPSSAQELSEFDFSRDAILYDDIFGQRSVPSTFVDQGETAEFAGGHYRVLSVDDIVAEGNVLSYYERLSEAVRAGAHPYEDVIGQLVGADLSALKIAGYGSVGDPDLKLIGTGIAYCDVCAGTGIISYTPPAIKIDEEVYSYLGTEKVQISRMLRGSELYTFVAGGEASLNYSSHLMVQINWLGLCCPARNHLSSGTALTLLSAMKSSAHHWRRAIK